MSAGGGFCWVVLFVYNLIGLWILDRGCVFVVIVQHRFIYNKIDAGHETVARVNYIIIR